MRKHGEKFTALYKSRNLQPMSALPTKAETRLASEAAQSGHSIRSYECRCSLRNDNFPRQ
jgi:hypothetical protein